MGWTALAVCILIWPTAVAAQPIAEPPPTGALPAEAAASELGESAEPPRMKPQADPSATWLAWQPRPEYGPGSEDRHGWRLLDWRTREAEIELRIGYERFTRKRSEAIAEAQETFDYPITPLNLKLPGEEKDARFDPTVWAADVIKWYRLVYLAVSFR
jgi:hypothetical protein